MRRRLGIALGIVVAALLVVQLVVPPLVSGPMARWMSRRATAQLAGYRVDIGAVDVDPLGFGARLRDVVLQDVDRRQPPLMRAPRVDAGVALSGLHVVSNVRLHEPRIDVDEARLREARRTGLATQVERIGRDAVRTLARWRGAIGEVRMLGGRAVWHDPAGDTVADRLGLRMANRESGGRLGGLDDRYGIRLKARVPDSGRVSVRGDGTVFEAPSPRMSIRLDARTVPLDAFSGIARHARVDVGGGVASADAAVALQPGAVSVHLREARLADARIDVLHTAPTWTAEQARLRTEAEAARTALAAAPPIALRADRVVVERSAFGVRDPTAPTYRVFLAIDHAVVTDVKTPDATTPAHLRLRGRPMGTGELAVDGAFRAAGAERNEVSLRIEARDVVLPTLNDALRANGVPSMSSGRFSMVLQADVDGAAIRGYVEPFFQDVEFEARKDAGTLRKLATKALDAVTDVLENDRGEVATRTTLSGTVESPRAGIWQAVVGVLRNAFVEAIVPEFNRLSGTG